MGESWSRNWTESTVVGGRGERAEPEVRTPKQNERDGGVWPYWEGTLDGLAMVTLRRVGEAGSLLSMATLFLLQKRRYGRILVAELERKHWLRRGTARVGFHP